MILAMIPYSTEKYTTNLFDSHLNLCEVLFVGTKILDEVGVRSDLDLHA